MVDVDSGPRHVRAVLSTVDEVRGSSVGDFPQEGPVTAPSPPPLAPLTLFPLPYRDLR